MSQQLYWDFSTYREFSTSVKSFALFFSRRGNNRHWGRGRARRGGLDHRLTALEFYDYAYCLDCAVWVRENLKWDWHPDTRWKRCMGQERLRTTVLEDSFLSKRVVNCIHTLLWLGSWYGESALPVLNCPPLNSASQVQDKSKVRALDNLAELQGMSEGGYATEYRRQVWKSFSPAASDKV